MGELTRTLPWSGWRIPRIPEFALPASLASVASRLPQAPPTFALVQVLNLLLARLLSPETLEPLEGRVVCLRVSDAGLTLRFVRRGGRFRVVHRAVAPELTITASSRDFLALAARQEDPDTLFFGRRLTMQGDTELGVFVKNTLDAVDLSTIFA